MFSILHNTVQFLKNMYQLIITSALICAITMNSFVSAQLWIKKGDTSLSGSLNQAMCVSLTDFSGNPSLTPLTTTSSENAPFLMTVPACISWCQQQNYKYAGLSLGNQCVCGNLFSKRDVFQVNNKDLPCDLPCPYDLTGSQNCGGNNAFSFYSAYLNAAPGNFLANGDFETNAAANCYARSSCPLNSINAAPWTVNAIGADLHRSAFQSGWNTTNGDWSVHLKSNSIINQTIALPLTPGLAYSITFQLTTNNECNDLQNKTGFVQITDRVANNSTHLFTFSSQGVTISVSDCEV